MFPVCPVLCLTAHPSGNSLCQLACSLTVPSSLHRLALGLQCSRKVLCAVVEVNLSSSGQRQPVGDWDVSLHELLHADFLTCRKPNKADNVAFLQSLTLRSCEVLSFLVADRLRLVHYSLNPRGSFAAAECMFFACIDRSRASVCGCHPPGESTGAKTPHALQPLRVQIVDVVARMYAVNA
jgi:hypothetical protein